MRPEAGRPARRRRKDILAAVCLLMVYPGLAAAQDRSPEPPGFRVRLGPLYLNPTLAIQEIGVDTNVFNEPEDPKRDFTASILTQLEASVLMGPARITGLSAAEYLWFSEYAQERSVNALTGARFDLFLNRVRPWLGAEWRDTRARPDAEIDIRARRSGRQYHTGADLRAGSRTVIRLSGRREEVEFDSTETFRGVNLAEALNHATNGLAAQFRLEATPLTTLVAGVEHATNRFVTTRLRDADSQHLTAGFEFRPAALLGGRASLGWRRFTLQTDEAASFQGLTADLQLTYAWLASTLVEGRLRRDVAFSFLEAHPYYVMTAASAEVTQRVAGPFEVVGRLGQERLAYRDFNAGTLPRIDRVLRHGAALGVRIGGTARVRLNFERAGRRSTSQPDQRFDRDKLFASMHYDF